MVELVDVGVPTPVRTTPAALPAPSAPAQPPAPPVADPRWRAALDAVLREPARLRLHPQPLVELTTGLVTGYEMLSRFEGPWRAAPDVWFEAAERWGHNATLQAHVLRTALDARADLPPDTFLTVNLDPHLLGEGPVREVLEGTGDLARTVLELTEHSQMVDPVVADRVLEHVRGAGGLLAIDDVGTGYAGLEQMLRLRPDILKLDRVLITGVDADPVKRSLVELLGDLAGRMDAWILGEGIETREELETLIGLGVPLGQGWVLARPQPTMLRALPLELIAHIRRTSARRSLRDHVVSLLRPARVVAAGREDGDVRLDARGMVADVRGIAGTWAPATTVAPREGVPEVLRRALARSGPHRYDPLVCTDDEGRVLGVLPLDVLVEALADRRASA
ncbi:EAL domain-containing protein [Cellulomonas endophytica]|uniref:EAL domain-containing protein n=1 Tax=Cellulomonas endophytica TaxID=2494735 RepID=UPI00101147F3|nr:EAL domain-containing protein [Cellulomonas endophytica]